MNHLKKARQPTYGPSILTEAENLATAYCREVAEITAAVISGLSPASDALTKAFNKAVPKPLPPLTLARTRALVRRVLEARGEKAFNATLIRDGKKARDGLRRLRAQRANTLLGQNATS